MHRRVIDCTYEGHAGRGDALANQVNSDGRLIGREERRDDGPDRFREAKKSRRPHGSLAAAQVGPPRERKRIGGAEGVHIGETRKETRETRVSGTRTKTPSSARIVRAAEAVP